MVKIKLPTVNKVKYFSDGAVSQYKNYKCLTNFIYHIVDHQINAEHHFFAKSHGKKPCDGIGGTIKREAAKASLRAAITNQILPPQDLFSWAQKNIKGVNIFYLSSDDINNHETTFNLQKRYEGMRTVPGTRSYHCFVPDGEKLFLQRISSDTDVLNDANLILKNPSNFQPSKYIACFYDEEWYIGFVVDICNKNQDINVKFMQRNKLNLKWINNARSSQCWVPFDKIICQISVPLIKSISARDYILASNDYDSIMSYINQR